MKNYVYLFKNNSHFTAIAWPGVLWHTSKNVIGDDCPNLRIGGGSNIATSTVEHCKVLCLEHPRCTAFNFDGNAKNCVLRACSLPVVPPTSDAFPTYDGYWLSSGTTGLGHFVNQYSEVQRFLFPGDHVLAQT